MKRILAVALLLTSLPAPALSAPPSVEVASANWNFLPLMKQKSNDHLSNKAIVRIHEIAKEGKCTSVSLRRGLLDFDMSFAAHFNPDGSLLLPLLGNARLDSDSGQGHDPLRRQHQLR